MKTWIARLGAVLTAVALSAQGAGAVSPKGYRYDSLDPVAQATYDLLLEHPDDLEEDGVIAWDEWRSGTREEYDAFKEEVLLGVDAFRLEHPEFFWLTGGTQFSSSFYDHGETIEWSATLTLPFHAPWSTGGRSIKDDRAAMEARIAELADEARAAGESRYAQLGFLHDWLTHHNEYNDAARLSGPAEDGAPWTAISALDEDLSPVCEGYAEAFYLLCVALDVPCILQSNENHKWNLVQMEDGNWYGVDVTYDDPMVVRQTGLVSGRENRANFLQGADTFWKNHPLKTPDGPELHPTAYAESDASQTGTAYPSAQTVLVDGVPVEFAMYALRDEAGNATNYVRIRDVAAALNGTPAQFDVGWFGQVNVVTGQSYTGEGEKPVPFQGDKLYRLSHDATNVNGQQTVLSAIVLTDAAGGGYTYYQLRDLGKTLGFEVDWSSQKGVTISTKP